jgi:hypothetical protein
MELSAARWTALRAPEPSTAGTGTHQYASLYSVSCPAAGVCASVGTYENTQGGSEGLVETLTAGTWAPTAVPGPTGAKTGATSDVYLASVSCSSTAACEAVGYYQLAANGYPGLIDTFDGTTWTPTEAPQPAGAATAATKITFTLTSVACPAVGSCVAVGQFHDVTGTGHAQGLVEVLSGGTWTSATLPVPATAGTGTDQFAELYGVSCPAAGSCAAVGRYKNTKGDTQGLIGVLSGTTWIGLASPLPSNAGTVTTVYSNLDAVTCPLPGACTAVGTSGGHYHGLIDTLSEGAWTATAAPEPSTAGAGAHQDASLGSVACSGATCAAGGYFDNAAGGSAGLLETTGTAPSGYFEAASDGGIFSFTAPFHGSMGGKPLNAPIVASAADPYTGGYYEVASDGGIFAFTAPFKGSMGGKPLNKPIVGMAFDTRTGGYYEVASDGGIFAFTAPFHGSMGGKPLNEPIVGMAFDPSTGGYWEVASDGGLFAFTAPFLGSMGGKPLNKPIVGMTYDTLTGGYYEVASDGGLFAFTAPFLGSMGGKPLNEPIVGMAFDYGTGGYWEVATDGGLFAFTAPFLGSMGGKPLNEPIVTMATG